MSDSNQGMLNRNGSDFKRNLQAPKTAPEQPWRRSGFGPQINPTR